MKKKIKRILIILSAVLVVGVLFFVSRGSKNATKFILDTEKITRRDISTSVTATGTVEPIRLVEVGTQVSGVISNIYVDYNSIVKKGDVLAELDKKLLVSELETAQANLDSKQVEFDNSQKNYVRQKRLWEKQAISKADWEEAEASYEVDKLAVTSSKAAVLRANTNLGYATIFSTIDGVVISRAVEEGQTVAASFSTPTLFTIANDLTKMRVIADVDEADIGGVVEGQRVTFTVDAFPDDEFQGSVVQVRLEAVTTSNVVTYEVVIDAPNPDLKLKPGLTANIVIYTLEEKNVKTIPSRALRFTPDELILSQLNEDVILTNNTADNQSKRVWVKEGNNIFAKNVVLGVSDGIRTELISGLSDNDEIVVGITQKETSAVVNNSGETSPFMPQRPGRR